MPIAEAALSAAATGGVAAVPGLSQRIQAAIAAAILRENARGVPSTDTERMRAAVAAARAHVTLLDKVAHAAAAAELDAKAKGVSDAAELAARVKAAVDATLAAWPSLVAGARAHQAMEEEAAAQSEIMKS